MNMRLVFILLLLSLLCGLHLTAQVCPPADVPDPLFQDSNGDGIDGDSSRAIFVSGTAGNDANPGTMLLPVKTIAQAIALANAALPTRDVYVAAGTYTPASSITMASGVSLYGLFDGPPSWQRSNLNTTTISGVTPVVVFSGVSAETHLEGFTLSAANGLTASASSYGVVVGASPGPIYIRYNSITAGNGAAGADGVDGPDGVDGGIGQNGVLATCSGPNGAGGLGGTSVCLSVGGAGGAGGPAGQNAGTPGANGSGGASGGTAGAAGGPFCAAGGSGGNGSPGLNGADGGNTLIVDPVVGVFSGVNYVPSSGLAGTSGTSGKSGGGGGGGGGTGGPFCTDGGGNGGGGGGAGGCAGVRGTAGLGGGGSFGIVSASSVTIIDGNTIVASQGGNGGKGGNGGGRGLGGPGGNGGNACSGAAGLGGSGGQGGNGGAGGAASGGLGGPSVGIVTRGVPAASAGTNSITTGTGGLGGAAGVSPTGSSVAGVSGFSQNVSGTTGAIVAAASSVCPSDLIVEEPRSGATMATFSIFLSSPSATQVDVAYATEDSSATAGSDYESAAGVASFLPGEVFKHVQVQINSDFLNEPDEVFILRLLSSSGADIVDSTGRGVIVSYPMSFVGYTVDARWNMVSLPVTVADDSVSAIFPTAVTGAYALDPVLGYAVRPTLEHGLGYWLKFSGSQIVNILGFPILADTIPVKAGWNLLGSVTDSIPASSVETIPPGLLASPFFGYDGGYSVQSTIHPAKGYMVKANDSGFVVLRPVVMSLWARVARAGSIVDGLNSLTISDPQGGRQSLYFGERKAGTGTRMELTLPPAPPAGSFDARFASDRMAVFVGEGSQEVPVQIMASAYPVRIAWGVKGSGVSASIRIGRESYALTHDGSAVVSSAGEAVLLEMSDAPAVPHILALEQNYPNPFNPTTTIPYSLPASVHVRLTIVNTLGEEVAKLVDEERPAGFQQAVWDASSVPSGVYFYRLEAGTFTGVKKLLLMR